MTAVEALVWTLLPLVVLMGGSAALGADAPSGRNDDQWVVIAKRIPPAAPLISSSTTESCRFPYNPALFPLRASSDFGALVRCQNLSRAPYDVGPSVMCRARIGANGTKATQNLDVVFKPTASYEKCGTEDPRVAVWNNRYYLFYTAYDCTKAALALAVTRDPFNPSAWTRHGILFPNATWSKSGAAILGRNDSQYLIWGDSSMDKGLHVATSKDGIAWTTHERLILPVRRPPFFDTELVEAGPPPLPLTNSGHLLFLYNSARPGFPSPKPGYALQYNVGFAVLNGSDPSRVLQRSAQPLLSPSLPWEVGNTTQYLTPNVVFVEGMQPTAKALTDLSCPGSHKQEEGRFLAIYGAADSAVSSAEVIACKRQAWI